MTQLLVEKLRAAADAFMVTSRPHERGPREEFRRSDLDAVRAAALELRETLDLLDQTGWQMDVPVTLAATWRVFGSLYGEARDDALTWEETTPVADDERVAVEAYFGKVIAAADDALAQLGEGA